MLSLFVTVSLAKPFFEFEDEFDSDEIDHFKAAFRSASPDVVKEENDEDDDNDSDEGENKQKVVVQFQPEEVVAPSQTGKRNSKFY